MSLKDKVIIITGASGGIGAATAKTLSEEGMKVVLTGRSEEKLAKAAEGVANAVCVAGDICAPDMPDRLIKTAIDCFGRLDAVFNNAGVMNVGSVEGADVDSLCEMVRINFESVVRMSYAALRFFKAQGSGFLVNTSSLAGVKVFPNVGVYCGTKFALEAMTEAFRLELAGSGVRVSCIQPGRTETGLFDHWKPEQKFDPKDGMISAVDVARSVRFILEQPDEVLIPRLLVVPSKQNR